MTASFDYNYQNSFRFPFQIQIYVIQEEGNRSNGSY